MSMKKEIEKEWKYPEILHPFWLIPIIIGILLFLLLK